jgi:hypothetical protein
MASFHFGRLLKFVFKKPLEFLWPFQPFELLWPIQPLSPLKQNKREGHYAPTLLLIRRLQFLEIGHDNISCVAFDIIFSGVFAIGKFAFDIEALAFVEDLGHHFGGLAPGEKVVPGGDDFFFTVFGFAVFMGGHGHAGHFFAFSVFFDFDFLAEEADELYAVVYCRKHGEVKFDCETIENSFPLWKADPNMGWW